MLEPGVVFEQIGRVPFARQCPYFSRRCSFGNRIKQIREERQLNFGTNDGGWERRALEALRPTATVWAVDVNSRARDLCRINPYAHNAKDLYAAYLVGGGIVPAVNLEAPDTRKQVAARSGRGRLMGPGVL